MQNLPGDPRDRRPAAKLVYVVPFLAALALIWILYKEMFQNWWGLWTEQGSFYAHAVFVPFFVAVMVWRNRERLAAARWKPSWIGALLVIPTMILLLLGKQADVTVLKSISFIILLFGSLLLITGPAKTRVLLFPMLFIITMIPLFPDQLINVIAFPIQIASTKIATFFLNLLTLHASREGTMIQMESYKMAVEGACSGFKTLISLLTFAGAFAYLVEAPLWKRWLLFLITPPLSLLINGLRITFIGIVGELISSKAATTFHDYSGFIVLILAFAFLFNFAKLIKCESFLGIPLQDDDPKGSEKEDTEAGENRQEEPAPPAEPAWWQQALAWRPTESQMRRVTPFVVAIDLVLLSTLAVQGKVVREVKTLPPIATTQVPKTLTDGETTWTLQESSLTDKLAKNVQDQLSPTRLINRNYDGSDGSMLEMFMTAGNARWTFHDPHNCSLGSGTAMRDVGVVTIPTEAGPLQALEARFKLPGSQEEYIMMFFYLVSGDTVLQRTEQVHKALVMQTFLGDSGKPSYFLRFTQRLPGGDEEKRQQMIRFVAAMWKDISPVLTQKVAAIPEPPPTPLEESH